jgi:hypothetical protein
MAPVGRARTEERDGGFDIDSKGKGLKIGLKSVERSG